MPAAQPRSHKIGLLSLSALIAVVVWVGCGIALVLLLRQQTQLEQDAQRMYDGSSAQVFEATRTIRGLERLAREGDALNWIDSAAERTVRLQRLRSLLDDATLQGDEELRNLVRGGYEVLTLNHDDLNRSGMQAQVRSADRWAPVMQQIIDKSEAVGAVAADVATKEADRILESTEQARTLVISVAAALVAGTVVLFVAVHILLTRRVVRLAGLLNRARDGKPFLHQEEPIQELQMLHDAAVAMSSAYRELETTRLQMEQMAHTDALTGLANRRMFELQGQQSFASAHRHGELLTVIVFDIDHFKRINDEFGHEGGDVVLRALGDYLLGAVRSDERPPARVGGEEFALLVTRTAKDDTLIVAERLRKGISALAVAMPNGRTITFTTSMGVAHRSPDDADLSAMLRRADVALYRAKENGRNRVEQAV